jgi:DNA-binding response OmpR family regulator
MLTATAKPILIVDDETAVLQALSDFLESEGFLVKSISNYQDAEYLYNPGQDLPGLILLDVYLGGKTGVEIARTLRSLPHTRGIPILLMSAQLRDAITPDIADGLLKKPFNIDELLSRVAELLGN